MREKKYQFYLEMLGTKQRVLFEHREKDNSIKGFTSNYIRVKTTSQIELTNKFADFILEEIEHEFVTGQIQKVYED